MAETRKIIITQEDAERLREAMREAQQGGYRGSAYLDSLKAELERAVIVPAEEVPQEVITMNSRVRLLDLDSNDELVLTLAYPKDVDAGGERVSVLAPIGTAILGYRTGDTIEWRVPDGVRRLQVKEVIYQPEASGDMDR
ncbi:MAG: nucleoside diphosphate kinase regulator [Anaerolineales bacterium]|nr:nucleoside diphosphate kinase regulator [Anaerolineales bacterium]